MREFSFLLPLCLVAFGAIGWAQSPFESDIIKTSSGDLKITFIGHGSLVFQHGGLTVHVDPVSQYADYSQQPKADIILVTHDHSDHLDGKAIEAIRTPKTVLVGTAKCVPRVTGMAAIANGERRDLLGVVRVDAVPAYNIVNRRPNGEPFHAKGDGNGYIITFGDKRVYVAGDSENTPEMKALRNIDVAFLPMNLPYTMTPEMVADAARAFAPKILYPYHYGNTDTSQLTKLLAGSGIDVRIRKLQ